MNYRKNYLSFAKLVKVTTAFALIISGTDALAFNLNDAIITAHENNYNVLAEFENLEATKMQRPKAYAGFLPTVKFTNSNARNESKTAARKAYNQLNNIDKNTQSNSLTIQQPIFNGGESLANIKIADISIDAGYARFKAVSNEIALNSVRAYENVLTTREIYQLNIKNEEVLSENLKFTKTRFKHGEVTKTDVMQSEAEYARALSDKEQAYGDMKSAEANFIRIHGLEIPETLENINLDIGLIPSTIDELLDMSLKNNPSLLQSRLNSEVSKYTSYQTYSKLLPDVGAQADFTRTDMRKELSTEGDTYTLQVSVPIFQSGAEYADIFEKQHLAKKAELNSLETERAVKEEGIRSWNAFRTAQAVIKSSLEAIDFSQKALEGVKEEAKIGTRTTLDVLEAERQLFNAKVNLRKAQQNLVVSVYTILQLMGSIEPVDFAAK